MGIGYARPYAWHVYSKWKPDAVVSLITISLLVLSKLIVITLVITFYNDARELMRGKNSPVYYYFWGCHYTTFGALVVGNTVHIALTQENKFIALVSYLSGVIDFIGAVIIVLVVNLKSGKELLPVPLTAYFKLCEKLKCCYNPWEFIMNIVALFFTFFLISSLLQMVPNILISYYAFPSRTLIHIGFFQVGFVCLVVAFGGITYHVEKFGWLIHIKKHGRIPDELDSTALIFKYINIRESEPQASTGAPSPNPNNTSTGGGASIDDQQQEPQHNLESSTLQRSSSSEISPPPNPNNTLNPTGGASIATGTISVETDQQQQRSAPTESTEPFQDIVYSRTAELKQSKCLWIVFVQILTAFLGVAALTGLIVVIGIIVFTDTIEKDDLQGILTLLPTIAVDVAIILTRKRYFDNKQALKYRLERVVEVMVNPAINVVPNERTPLLQRPHTD